MEGGQHPLELLKAKHPSLEDLEHLSDLLEQLDHIRRTGAPSERTKRELPHLILETQLKEAREILGAENVIGPDEVAQVWFPSLSPRGRGQGEGASEVLLFPFEIPRIPYSREDLEKARELGMFLILRISHDQEGQPLTPARMNELIRPRLDALNQGKLFSDIDWYKNEAFFTDETPTTPSLSPPSEKGEKPLTTPSVSPSKEGENARVVWKLVTKDILPDSTDKNYLEQTKLLRDTLASLGWLTDEEAAEVTDQKLEALRSLVESENKTEWQETARILSTMKLNQNHRRTFSGALYDTVTFFLTRNERLLEGRYNWTQTYSSRGDLVLLGYFARPGAGVDRCSPGERDGIVGVGLSR